MPTDYTTNAHLSKDELLEILNEIDTEGQAGPKDIKDHCKENPTYPIYPNPNPSDQFH